MGKKEDKWDNVDWNLTTSELVKILGVSRQRIHQKRPKHIRPKSVFFNVNKFLKNLDVSRWNRCRTIRDIAELEGVTVSTLYKYAKDECAKWTDNRRKLKFIPINWDLPSTDIEAIWGLPLHKASFARPKDHPPKWRVGGLNQVGYEEALQVEKLKAKGYYYEE